MAMHAADIETLIRAALPDAVVTITDLAGAGGCFSQAIQVAVDGQDQRAIIGDGKVFRRDGDALPLQLGDFRLQRPRVEHDAIANDRQRAAHNAAGQQG